MREFFISSILVLIFSVGTFAQTNEKSSCPKIKIFGPVGTTQPGQSITYTANINNELNNSVVYNWSVSAGTIFEGQGTSVIKVALTADTASQDITVSVEVKGLPENCSNTFTEQIAISIAPHLICDPGVLDEYEDISFKEEKQKLNAFAIELQKIKDSKAYFIIYVPGKVKKETVNSRITKIKNYMTETQKIPEENLLFVFSESDFYRTRIYIVPPIGAECK